MRSAGNFNPEWGYLAPAPNVMRTARMVVVATAIGATAGAAVVLSLVDRPVPGAMVDASNTLVVVRSLVQPAEAAVPTDPMPAATMAQPVAAATPAPMMPTAPAALAAPVTIQASAPPPVQASAPATPPPAPQVTAKISAPVSSEARPISTPAAPAAVAALAESPPTTETVAPASDTVTADPAAATLPKGAAAPAAKKLPATATTATGQAPAQHNAFVAPAPPKKKTAGNDGLAPILRRLFSAN
jgi:ribonuclease E